jgi:hypothetical protein
MEKSASNYRMTFLVLSTSLRFGRDDYLTKLAYPFITRDNQQALKFLLSFLLSFRLE